MSASVHQPLGQIILHLEERFLVGGVPFEIKAVSGHDTDGLAFYPWSEDCAVIPLKGESGYTVELPSGDTLQYLESNEADRRVITLAWPDRRLSVKAVWHTQHRREKGKPRDLKYWVVSMLEGESLVKSFPPKQAEDAPPVANPMPAAKAAPQNGNGKSPAPHAPRGSLIAKRRSRAGTT